MKIFLIISLFLFNFLFFIFSSSVSAQEGKFYQLNLFYNQVKLELKTITVFPGSVSQSLREGDYRFDLVSLTGNILYGNKFQIPILTHGEDVDPQTGVLIRRDLQRDAAEVILNIPYFPNGKEIGIYDPDNKKILTISVAHFAEVTPTPISPTTESKVTKGNSSAWIFLGIFLAALIGLVVFVYLQFKIKKV